MEIGIGRIFLVGFATLVLMCQDIALGFCHQSQTIFLETCPCSQGDERCPCQGPDGCATFLDLELDSFAKAETASFIERIEPAISFVWLSVIGFGPEDSAGESFEFADDPDPPLALYGRTMLCRYCVARI